MCGVNPSGRLSRRLGNLEQCLGRRGGFCCPIGRRTCEAAPKVVNRSGARTRAGFLCCFACLVQTPSRAIRFLIVQFFLADNPVLYQLLC